MGSFGKVSNPIGAIAPKSGIGQLLDPAGAIGRKVGGTAGQLIDPAGSFRNPEDFQPRQSVAAEPEPKGEAKKRRSSLLNR